MSKLNIQEIMRNPNNIRNMSVIAHVDHGKSTLTDALLNKAGIVSADQAGEKIATNTHPEEKARGITIKSTGVSIFYESAALTGTEKKEAYLINIIDSPGHVDFSSEVTAALRVTDGALVVVDAVQGVCVQTETVLRQACAERIKSVLIVNKVDRCIFELKHDGESIYQSFVSVIDKVNVIQSTYTSEEINSEADIGEELKKNEKSSSSSSFGLHPSKGNVAFGSGRQNWAFTLANFANLYSKQFKTNYDTMMNRLWGDYFYNPATKTWQTSPEVKDSSQKLKRAFVSFVIEPICKLAKACFDNDKEVMNKILESVEVVLTEKEREKTGKDLVKVVMSKWLNCGDTILDMVVMHLPSPKQAQQYRTPYLYEGPLDDECAIAMRNCDPQGPLMMYVSKMVPMPGERGRFYAFGRVFSGTVGAGKKVRILGSNYNQGGKSDLSETTIGRTVVMMCDQVESLSEVPCGNTCALVGIDNFILKSGTVTDNPKAHTIRNMKYSVSPVVRVAVKPANPADMPKLVDGLKRLSKSDPLVVCIIDEATGENIVAGSGELHVEICLNDLENEYAGVKIIRSDPVVSYKQTVTKPSSIYCMSKSANKHNRLTGYAEPLDDKLVTEIEDGKFGGINAKDDPKVRGKYLQDNYNWDKAEGAEKLWCFGPENSGANVLVDVTKAVQYMQEIRDSCSSAFQWATKQGVLTEEPMRGVRMNIMDTVLHTDSIHRGDGQIIPAARRLYYSSELTAEPKLQEPVFMVEITVPQDSTGGVYTCLNKRRGLIVEEETISGTPMSIIKSYLPVSESFGFTENLRGLTKGKAFPQCVFHHWDTIESSPLEKGSQAYEIVLNIRKRKGLKDGLPELNEYLDKL